MATQKPSPLAKSSPISARPKKPTQKNLMVKILLSSRFLAQFPTNVEPKPIVVENTVEVIKDEPAPLPPPTTANVVPVETAISTPQEGGSPTNSATPAPSALDDSSAMPPPSSTIVKSDIKKGIKRTSDAAGLNAKPRAKPGPKKKKLEDGTIISTNTGGPKLGPKANQGAINAGLRALDRSGKPCRKWSKGKFEIKSFTGATWGIGRWTAPAKIAALVDNASSSGDSTKELKDNSNSQPTKSDQHSVNTPELAPNASQEAPTVSAAPISSAVAAVGA